MRFDTAALGLLTFTICSLAVGQVLFKMSAGSLVFSQPKTLFSPILLAALVLYGVATVTWLLVLKRMPLSVAFPFYGLVFCIVPLLSHFILDERIRPLTLVGGGGHRVGCRHQCLGNEVMSQCPACGSELRRGLAEWHLRCAACSYEGSSLTPHILEQREGGDLDEDAREDGLRSLRLQNFRELGERLRRALVHRSAAGERPALLDVGCAHGWFIEQMRSDFDCLGIEPDRLVADKTRARGLEVRDGFFPDVLHESERFDLIVFNDVLEHIPDVGSVLEACHHHLKDGGMVVVNAPDRRGFFYRLSKFLAKVGMRGSFDRLWQKGFPSPHLHYFDEGSLSRIALKSGLVPSDSFHLASITCHGLYERIRYSESGSALSARALTIAISAAIPLIALMPADISVWLLKKDGEAVA